MRLLRAIRREHSSRRARSRPDLPEALEAIVLRAMHVSPKQRFESIHALGQKLWEFASPRGQAQWKTFYFHTPAAASPLADGDAAAPARGARTSPLGAALVAAARAHAGRQRPANAGRFHRVARRRSSALAKTEPLSRRRSARATSRSRRPPPHRAWANRPACPTPTSPAKAPSATRATRQPPARPPRRALARRARRRRRRGPRRRHSARLADERPRRHRCVLDMVAGPATPARPLPPPLRRCLPPLRPLPGRPPHQLRCISSPSPAKPAQAGAADERAQPPQPTEKKKRATRRHKAPKLDQHGIGIPTE